MVTVKRCEAWRRDPQCFLFSILCKALCCCKAPWCFYWTSFPFLLLLSSLFSCSVMCESFFNPMDCISPVSRVHVGFPKQEYRSGLQFPSSGIFLTQRLNPHLLHWHVDSLLLSHQGSLYTAYRHTNIVTVFQIKFVFCCIYWATWWIFSYINKYH